MAPAKKKLKKQTAEEDDVDEDAEKDEEEESDDESKIRLPLTSKEAKGLVAFLTKRDPSTEPKKKIQNILKQVNGVGAELEALLSATSRNQENLDKWREYWEESLESHKIESETAESTKQLLDWVCSHIITGPKLTLYDVPAKHGDVIKFTLLSFETLESDGSKQKILVEHYGFNYDSETGLRLFSKEIEKKDISFAKHRAHISKHEMPDKVPEDGDSFLGSDELGAAFVKGGEDLEFAKIMETRKAWQVVLSMIDFSDESWQEMF